MKITFSSALIMLVASAVLFSGCASYNAASLNSLSSEEFIRSSGSSQRKDVIVTAKAFNKMDCKRYLDRDVIKKGYQPVQLYIQNNSDKSYAFSLSRLSLPYARSEEIAEKVHTSTVGRILGYGIPGLIVAWPLIIPAVVDGIKSSEANALLDNDFASKVATDQLILPYSHFNKIIFVPICEYQSSVNITIMDQETNQPNSFDVVIPQPA